MKIYRLILLVLLVKPFVYTQVFELPKLKFEYKDLEPNIDVLTMEIHYSKHHQGYVNNLNKAVKGTEFEKNSLEEHLLSISRRNDAIRNNAGGHYNHTLFWEILTPIPNTKPNSSLEKAIIEDLGGIDSLKAALSKAAASRFGSGWAWVIVDSKGKLKICSTANQDNPLMDVNPQRGIPIIGIDVWEHAYYLKYQNKRGDYLTAIWNVLDWEEISKKYEKARISPLLSYFEIDSWTAFQTFKINLDYIVQDAVNGSLDHLKASSANLAMDALHLKSSQAPKAFDNEKVQTQIEILVKECNNLHRIVKKKLDDAVLKTKLFEVKVQFKKLEDICNNKR